MLSRNKRIFLLAVVSLLTVSALDCKAQFKEEAFRQNFNDDTAPADTSGQDKIFDFKKYFGAIQHKNEMDVTTSFEGATVLIGGMQIYNKDYWKLPLVYGGLAAGIGSGIYFEKTGNYDAAKWSWIGTGLVYWGTLMDGTINFKPDDWPSPGKAALYSLLVPGLGQIYNGEVWKLPIYWGIMLGGLDYYFVNKKNFERYRTIYNNQDTTYMPLETSKYYKNIYRRYRDYSVLVIVAGYFLQAIDANVFAYMHNFEVTEDLAMDISPTLIAPATDFAFAPAQSPALGISLGFRF